MAWKTEYDKSNSPYTELQIADAVKKAYSRKVEGLIVKGESGTYIVNFNLSFVARQKTSYSIVITKDGAAAEVVGSKNGTKTMSVDVSDNIGTYAHEVGHLAGIVDRYDDNGKFEGFENNFMASANTILSFAQNMRKAAKKPDFLNTVNYQDLFPAFQKQKTSGSNLFGIRNGVSRHYAE